MRDTFGKERQQGSGGRGRDVGGHTTSVNRQHGGCRLCLVIARLPRAIVSLGGGQPFQGLPNRLLRLGCLAVEPAKQLLCLSRRTACHATGTEPFRRSNRINDRLGQFAPGCFGISHPHHQQALSLKMIGRRQQRDAHGPRLGCVGHLDRQATVTAPLRHLCWVDTDCLIGTGGSKKDEAIERFRRMLHSGECPQTTGHQPTE